MTVEVEDKMEASTETGTPTSYPRFGQSYIGLSVGFVLRFTSESTKNKKRQTNREMIFDSNLVPHEFTQTHLENGV